MKWNGLEFIGRFHKSVRIPGARGSRKQSFLSFNPVKWWIILIGHLLLIDTFLPLIARKLELIVLPLHDIPEYR